MRVVVDASAVLALLLQQPTLADKVAQRFEKASDGVHMPHLLDIEVAQVLRRYAVANPNQAERCQQAIRDLRNMPAFRYDHFLFLDRIWDLHGQMATSDAAYIALAEFLEAPILTCNSNLEGQGHNVRIDLLTTTSP